jgi:hypothetical protein
MLLSPIALFVYNRLQHTIKTVEALKLSTGGTDTDLFIFCDGIKDTENINMQNKVAAVRAYVKSITGFKSIHIIEQSKNIGLSNALVNGISTVLQKFNSVIVIEDDMLVGRDFLMYMNKALNKYENEPKVAGISGYSFPINEMQPYFSRTGSCWGWATYKRVWDNFLACRNSLSLTLIPTNELQLFNVYDSVYSSMFLQNKQGIIQSWAIEFYLFYFSQKQYFLMPGVNLISNVGFDGSGAHKKKGNFLTDTNPVLKLDNFEFPTELVEPNHIRKKLIKLYSKGYAKPSFLKSFVNKIKSVLLGNENNHH